MGFLAAGTSGASFVDILNELMKAKVGTYGALASQSIYNSIAETLSVGKL